MASIKSKTEIVSTTTMSTYDISNTINDMLNSIEEQGGEYIDLKISSFGERSQMVLIVVLYKTPSKKASDTDEVDLSLLC